MPPRAIPTRSMLVNLRLDQARWIDERSAQMGETKTRTVRDAIDNAMKQQERLERCAQRKARAR
jgi:hypothetical protein